MNQFLVLSLIVCVFAVDVFCRNSSNLGLPSPPPPKNAEFGKCFVVPEMGIKSNALDTQLYQYHHICPVKPSRNSSQKLWCAVGSLRDHGHLTASMSKFDYVKFDQSLIKFTFLREAMVRFVIEATDLEFNITFQSLSQSQSFYGKIYQDVNMNKAAPNKIGVLLEGNKKIGTNVEALYEDINGTKYITLQSKRGEPFLVFSQSEAAITQPANKQLSLRVHATNYTLTFSDDATAKQFSDALLK